MALTADQARDLMFGSCKNFTKVLAEAEAAIELAASTEHGEVEVTESSDGPVAYYDFVDAEEAARYATGKTEVDEMAATSTATPVVYVNKNLVPISPSIRLVERTLNERGFKTELFQKEVGNRIYRGRQGKYEVQIETVLKILW